jgi:hypothetical protein
MGWPCRLAFIHFMHEHRNQNRFQYCLMTFSCSSRYDSNQTSAMKRNCIYFYSTRNCRKLFVYCIRPIVIASFLFCQLSFQTDISNDVHDEERIQTGNFIKPANIVAPGAPQTNSGSDEPMESILQPGKNVEYTIPVKIKAVGNRSVEIYRIML